MSLVNRIPVGAVLAVVLTLASVHLRAQNALYVKGDADKWLLVRDVSEGRPMSVTDGRYKVEASTAYVLRRVPEYLPAYVTISRITATDSHLETERGNRLNEAFSLRANLISDYPLDHVFMVLDLNLTNIGRTLFLQEVGRLVPGKQKSVFAAIPIGKQIGGGQHFDVHLFADGQEIFHSEMPLFFKDRVLDQMVARRVKKLVNSQPKPFSGPPPRYPASLTDTKTDGSALIRLKIDRKGQVLEPVVVSASAPAFGQSALETIRLWRFLPRVRDGEPTESVVEMPFRFTYAE